jgi:hypothetical protein
MVALRGVVLHTAAWFAVAFSLLPFFGVVAIAYGWLAASAVEALVLGVATSRWTGARIVQPLRLPVMAFVSASAVGWVAASRLGQTVPAAGLATFVGEAVYFSVIGLCRRSLLIDMTRLIRKALSGDQPVHENAQRNKDTVGPHD